MCTPAPSDTWMKFWRYMSASPSILFSNEIPTAESGHRRRGEGILVRVRQRRRRIAGRKGVGDGFVHHFVLTFPRIVLVDQPVFRVAAITVFEPSLHEILQRVTTAPAPTCSMSPEYAST